MDADVQKTTIPFVYFVILIARPRGRMILLFGSSLRLKVSLRAIAREGIRPRKRGRVSESETSKKVGGTRETTGTPEEEGEGDS